MKFGVREICDVVFKAKSDVKIGKTLFKKGQPVLYIDTAKTSTLEGSATTVYATGGRGNTNLIAWEGEKALTFTVEDALLSPIGFSILSGAGLFKENDKEKTKVHAHQTATTTISTDGKIDLSGILGDAKIDGTAPIFAVIAETDGSITGEMLSGLVVDSTEQVLTGVDVSTKSELIGKPVFVDFYVVKDAAAVTELQIEAGTFAGNYYVEASTLFRRQADGVDMPAEITIPNAKIQSNFTFNMAATGDPSTFTFTMDALPGYTLFDNTKKVLCVIQMIDEGDDSKADIESVMKHEEDEVLNLDENGEDPDSAPDAPVLSAREKAKVVKALNALTLTAVTGVASDTAALDDIKGQVDLVKAGLVVNWTDPSATSALNSSTPTSMSVDIKVDADTTITKTVDVTLAV